MKVAHFIRKKGQLKSSFINNQIRNHSVFKPFIVFKYKDVRKGIHINIPNEIETLDLSKYNKKDVNFYYLKKVSNKEYSIIEDFIKVNNISILHFHFGSDAFIYSEIIKNTGLPSVVSFYGYDCSSYPNVLFGYGKRCLNNHVFKYIDAVLAMSPDMKKDLIEIGCPEKKVIVHYHGTDTEKFNISRKYEEKENIVILILANLVPKKGHIFLLKSIKHLIEIGIKNIQLRIVGEGVLGKKLKHFVAKNSLSELVRFAGSVKYASNEMIKEYKNADIFVHPSVVAPNGDKEGIPGTIIEAMASGLPIISTYHAGIPYIIEHEKNGLLVPENDVSALASSIEELIRNKEKRKMLGSNGQEYALNNLDLKVKEKELEEIYFKLIEK